MIARVERLGGAGVAAVSWLGAMGRFAASTVLAMVTPPFHFRSILRQLDSIGFGSLFIVGLTGFFAGLVFAWNSLDALMMMQAEGMVAPSMALSLSREIAPMLTALLVAGRTGSAVASELGTMRVSEQVDAMEIMGVDPIHYLVAPRAWAMIISLPLLDCTFLFMGLAGSVMVASPYGISPNLFIQEALRMADANDVLIGVVKCFVFGLMIVVIAAREGLSASGGARGVGKSATTTVVIASVLVLVLDYGMMLILAPLMLGFEL